MGPVTTLSDHFTLVDQDTPKPFVHPVRTKAGHVLTRATPADHPWHRGLWFTIKFVDEDNFWEEMEPYGTIVPRNPGSLDDDLDWIRPDGSVAITEHRTMTPVDLDEQAWALDWRFELTPTADVTLDRTPFTTWGGYGGLALRGSPEWHDTRILREGGEAKQRVAGRTGRWLDVSGRVGPGGDDDPEAGIALLDHPSNPRHPSPWYGSTFNPIYGDEPWSNFVNAAFLFHEPMPLEQGETLTMQYRVVVHDGTWDADRTEAAWQDWTGG
jgi:hypothetical protein